MSRSRGDGHEPMNDPLTNSPWSETATVARFSGGAPNERLVALAGQERAAGGRRLLDIGCGAGRNAVPLARQGWHVLGVDLSAPMVAAAAKRAAEEPGLTLQVALAPMRPLPVVDAAFDFVVAHGIWNLARSGEEFRTAVSEAARAARQGAALFVFTFSRATLPADAAPVAGESFVFTQFSGEPQCFLTEAQLREELAAHGFTADEAVPLRELNRPPSATLKAAATAPVIYEGLFRRSAATTSSRRS